MAWFDYVGIVFMLLLCFGLGILFLCGKGAFLIAGYNTLPKADKAHINERALLHFMGKVMLAITLCVAAIFAGELLSIGWLSTAALICFGITVCFTLVWASIKHMRRPPR